jgi:hypothetical protein
MDAIHEAARQASLTDYDIEMIEQEGGLFSFFGADGLARAKADVGGEVLSTLFSSQALRSLAWMASLQESPFLYLAPIELKD